MKTHRTLYIRIFLSSLLCSVILSCGKNSFRDAEAAPPTEEASKALEEGNPEKAIRILLEDLGSSVEHIYNGMSAMTSSEISSALQSEILKLSGTKKTESSSSLSILASAHAQSFGIDPLDIALSLITSGNDESSSGSSNTITLLYPVLPDATSENKAGLSQAIAILNAIPQEELTKADFFKQSLFLTANMSLITKTFDTDPADGEITLNELGSLDATTTDELLTLLETAIGAIVSTDQEGNLAQATEQIASIRSSIESQAGADDTEKLKEFLSNNASSIGNNSGSTLP
ncbi:MAG: hypothetical protein H6618_03715 [Deltaproteobacteria bacterium]|nr:hypothetical protein [Deltaproteobacteria bacterium]